MAFMIDFVFFEYSILRDDISATVCSLVPPTQFMFRGEKYAIIYSFNQTNASMKSKKKT